jgi:hypothetical protein
LYDPFFEDGFAAIPVYFPGERHTFVVYDQGADWLLIFPGCQLPFVCLIFNGQDSEPVWAWRRIGFKPKYRIRDGGG